MKEYRRIWEEAFGPIPIDDQGRGYEIHHIDGDRQNNALSNLMCVSILEHYLIHLRQGDTLAAAAVARRMNIDAKTKSRLSSLAGQEARDKGLGFHGLSNEEKLANSSLGGKAVKGMRWWNDGKTSKKSRACPGEGWRIGRVPCGTGMPIGTKLGVFWNNGLKNVRSINCPGEGWGRGKLLTAAQRKRRQEIASQPKSEESNKKRSLKLRGRKLSEEHKRKIREHHSRRRKLKS